jgi:GNAT superfamily N-acetyltransferase
MLGFFEAFDAPEEVTQLLSDAIGWLVGQGVQTVVGPMDGDTWHPYRFNVGPFDRRPFLMEPHNKPYYGALWERAGFEALENYYSKVVDAKAAAAPLAKIHQRVLDRGYRLRPISMSRFEEEMEIIYRLSAEIFSDNFLYEEISLSDFLSLYRPARSLIDPELVLIAETAGKPVGFVFALVDYYHAVVAMRGGDGLLAKLRFLLNRHRADAVNIKSLGVVRGHRRSGLAAALMCESYHTTSKKGLRQANLCLIQEGNPSGRLDGNVGVVSRRYVLYQYTGASQ